MQLESTQTDAALARKDMAALMCFAEEYHSDPDLREQVLHDPKAALAARDYTFYPDLDVRIVANTADTFYFVLPPDPNVALDDEALSVVAGGKSASTVGSASTASTAPSCASSASSIGTAGSAS